MMRFPPHQIRDSGMKTRLIVVCVAMGGFFGALTSPHASLSRNDADQAGTGSPRLHTSAFVGGSSHGILDVAGTPFIKSWRWMAPLDFTDTTPSIGPDVEYFPHYFFAMAGGNGTLYAANYADLMRREVSGDGQVDWPIRWNVELGGPVPAADPGGSYDYILKIAVPDGNDGTVVLLTRGGLRIVDDSDSPRELAYVPRLSEEHRVWPMVELGHRFFWFEHSADGGVIRAVNLSDPRSPVVTEAAVVPWTVDRTSGLTGHLALDGDHLYYAGPGEVRIFRLKPEEPSADPLEQLELELVSQFPVEHTVWDTLPKGDSLWLLTREEVLDDPVLRRADIGDPSSPQLSPAALSVPMPYWLPRHFEWTTPNAALDLDLASWNDQIMVIDGPGGGVRTIDTANPDSPLIAGRLDLLGACTTLVVSADRPFCVGADGPLEFISTSGTPVLVQPPTAPRELTYAPDAAAYDNGILQWNSTTSALMAFDVHQTGPPEFRGQVEIEDGYGVAVVGNRAFVPAGEEGYQGQTDSLVIVDLSDPGTPTQVGSLSLPVKGVVSMATSDTHLFLTGYEGGLIVIDARQTPQIVGRLEGLPGIRPDIAMYGDTIYVLTHESSTRQLIVVDIADPTSPRISNQTVIPGYLHTSNNTIVNAIDAERGWLLLVGTSNYSSPGLQVFDLSDAAEPRLLATHDTGSLTDLAVIGGTIYGATESAGVQVIDILSGWDYRSFMPVAFSRH
jgi:hypothetical protein